MPSPLAGLGSVQVSSDGSVYFSTRTNLNWIDPKSIRRNLNPPAVRIYEVNSDNQTTNWPSDPFRLGPNPQTVQIRYEAGSLLVPDRIRFRYRLENYDKDWIAAEGRRDAYYSKLPPGRYTFRVTAANDAGIWNTIGTSIEFTVPPTFVQTIWFKLAILLAGMILLLLYFRFRLNRTQRRIANHMYEILGERQRIARDLHDTLLQSVQALMFKIAIATRKLEAENPVREILETTLSQSDEVLKQGRKLISSLQTTEEPSEALLDSLRTIGENLRVTYPSTEFLVDARGSERILSTVVQPEVCTIGREALTNAFQHANAAHVCLTLYATPEELRLEVRDDGSGIDATILARGYREEHWGLRNMRARAQRLGGRFTLESSAEAGTTVGVSVPAFVAYKDAPRGLRETIRRLFR